jgi:hypothetical protein
MKKATYFPLILLVAAVILAAWGCAGPQVKKGGEPGGELVVENGVGKARKYEDSLDLAFRDALQKVVVKLIGVKPEEQNRPTLTTYMYDISQTYVATYEVTDKVKSGKDTIVYVRASLDRSKIEESLHTLGIEIPQVEEEPDYASSPNAPLINEAIDNLTYLVYFEPEKKNISDEYARLCVNRVNNYLANLGYEYIDLERINEVKDDYFTLYEETQGSVSVVQLIAQGLNADVYIVVDGAVEYEGQQGGVYFASASIDLKAFESATARGLGTETGYSGKLGLPSGRDAAMRKAVETAVEKSTAAVIDLSRSYMVKAFENGIRYEVVVQGLDSYETLKPFSDALRRSRNFRSLKEIGASAGQARYYVYYMGRKSELIDDVMNSLKGEEGFENFTVLVSRGNAVVFGIEE